MLLRSSEVPLSKGFLQKRPDMADPGGLQAMMAQEATLSWQRRCSWKLGQVRKETEVLNQGAWCKIRGSMWVQLWLYPGTRLCTVSPA